MLIGHSLLGTPVGDRVLAVVGNDRARYNALVIMLDGANAWSEA